MKLESSDLRLIVAVTEHKLEETPNALGLDRTARSVDVGRVDGMRIARIDTIEAYGKVAGVRITWVHGDT